MGLLSRTLINTEEDGRPKPGEFPHDNQTKEPKCWGKGCMCCRPSAGDTKKKR